MGWPKKKLDNNKPLEKTVKKTEIVNAENTFVQKAEIDRMKKMLAEKLKDPRMAKKAAMILSEMLNRKP